MKLTTHPYRLILTTVTLFALSQVSTVWATAGFSRQINADCRTCHFQSMKTLNKFGREFKLNAFGLSKKMKKELSERRKEKASSDSKN